MVTPVFALDVISSEKQKIFSQSNIPTQPVLGARQEISSQYVSSESAHRAVVNQLATHSSPKTFRLSCSVDPDTAIGQFLARIYTESFQRLDYRLDLTFAPPARSYQLLNTGKVDGDCARHNGFVEQYAELNLAALPIVLGQENAYIISLKSRPEVTVLDLARVNSIGHLEGAFWVETSILHGVPKISRIKIPQIASALKMIRAERVDAVVLIGVKYETYKRRSMTEIDESFYRILKTDLKTEFLPVISLSKSHLIDALSDELAHQIKRAGREVVFLNTQ